MSAPLPPELSGRYEVLGLLGRGASAVVFRARERASGREVALKLGQPAERSERLARFAREGQLTAALSHPGIIRIHEAGVAGRAPYLVYELLPGARTFAQVAPELPLRRRVELLRDAARALGHAHARGVVHRDVKGENLLIDGQGALHVADFGVAWVGDEERLTRTGVLVGTPAVMAPEQLQPRPTPCPQTDVWALGVVLYEQLTGELPFDAGSLPELIDRVLRATPTPPRSLAGDVPVELEAICLRALAKDPTARYAHGDALADDLQRWLEGGRTQAAPGGAPWLTLVAGAAGLLLAAALVAWSTLGRAPTPPPPAPTPPGEHPADAPGPGAIADAPDEGARAWAQVRAREEGSAQAAAALAWRRRFPDHALAAEAEALLGRYRLREPLWTLAHVEPGSPADTPVASCRFVGEGLLLTHGSEGVKLWSLEDGGLRAAWSLSHVGALALLGAGFAALDGGQRLVVVRDALAAEADPVQPVELEGWPQTDGLLQDLAVAADGRSVLLTDRGEAVVRVDLSTGRVLARYAHGGVTGLALSPDGGRLLALRTELRSQGIAGGAGTGDFSLWDVAASRRLGGGAVEGSVRCFAFSGDGEHVLLGTNLGEVYVRSARDARPEDALVSPAGGDGAPGPGGAADFVWRTAVAHPQGTVRGVASDPQGARVYSLAYHNDQKVAELKLWRWPERTLERTLVLAHRFPHSLTLSGDGALLAVGYRDGSVEVWLVR